MRNAGRGKKPAAAPEGAEEDSFIGVFQDCTPEEAAHPCGADVGITGVSH